MHVKTGWQTGSENHEIPEQFSSEFTTKSRDNWRGNRGAYSSAPNLKKMFAQLENNLLVVIPPLARLGELVRNLSNFFNSPLFLPIRISIWRRTCARYASGSQCRASRCCHLVLAMRGMRVAWKLVKQYGYGISFEHNIFDLMPTIC